MIMGPFKGVSSKIASNRPSRASSTARDTVKKREKPYKTETDRIMAKKRKLHRRTAYKQAPPGYKFLPVGTRDLFERCKELSRQKGCTIYLVNNTPASKHATNPDKVSHHIDRIGYHFRSNILGEACEELGYIYYRGHLVKAAELEARQQAVHQQTVLAKTLVKYGLDPGTLVKDQAREDLASVKAAIMELFPRMPEYDLQEIISHAWKQGTMRVGTNAHLDLPRRVQLATIARIRHEYTDYDRLLRAFDWAEARAMVESDCLKKLIEWRGEQEDEDDDQFEEIVRETIIIDDDDEDDARSIIDLDAGETSDDSVEITHHIAPDMDFDAESHDERPRPNILSLRPPAQSFEERNALKQKIGNARELIRAGAPPRLARSTAMGTPGTPHDHDEVVRVTVQPDQYGNYSGEVMVDGQRMRAVSVVPPDPARLGSLSSKSTLFSAANAYNMQGRPQPSTPLAQSHRYQRPVPTTTGYEYAHAPPASSAPALPNHLYQASSSGGDKREIYNQPVPSIEDDNSPRRAAPVPQPSLRPVTPDREFTTKRRRVQNPRPYDVDLTNGPDSHGPQRFPAQPEILDLTSPVRNSYVSRRSPANYDKRPIQNGYVQPQQGSLMYPAPIPPPGVAFTQPQLSHHYDPPRQVKVQYVQRAGPVYPVHGAPAPVQQASAYRLPPSATPTYQPIHNAPHPVQYASANRVTHAPPVTQYYEQYTLSQPPPPDTNGNTKNQLYRPYGQQG